MSEIDGHSLEACSYRDLRDCNSATLALWGNYSTIDVAQKKTLTLACNRRCAALPAIVIHIVARVAVPGVETGRSCSSSSACVVVVREADTHVESSHSCRTTGMWFSLLATISWGCNVGAVLWWSVNHTGAVAAAMICFFFPWKLTKSSILKRYVRANKNG